MIRLFVCVILLNLSKPTLTLTLCLVCADQSLKDRVRDNEESTALSFISLCFECFTLKWDYLHRAQSIMSLMIIMIIIILDHLTLIVSLSMWHLCFALHKCLSLIHLDHSITSLLFIFYTNSLFFPVWFISNVQLLVLNNATPNILLLCSMFPSSHTFLLNLRNTYFVKSLTMWFGQNITEFFFDNTRQ